MKNVSIGTYSIKDNITNILRAAYENGIRLFDAAPNYHDGLAHQYLNELANTVDKGDVSVTTKIGYIPRKEIGGLLQNGIIRSEEVFSNNCMSRSYIEYQLARNKKELDSCLIESMLLHNIEIQAVNLSKSAFIDRLSTAFHVLEEAVARGEMETFGVSTWHGFRKVLDIEEIIKVAESVAGNDHHFKVIQLPISLVNIEPLDNFYSNNTGILKQCQDLGLKVQASSPLHKGDLIKLLSPELISLIKERASPAVACYLFAISNPSVDRIITSPSKISHLSDLLELRNQAKLSAHKMQSIIEILTQDA